MGRQLVYDLPTRIFHWVIAGLFIVGFFIAKTIDDDSPTFAYHMLAGIMLSATVLLRIVWGFFGTQHSRFSSFALNPADLVGYFKGILTGERRIWAGHNPASSWAAIAMFALALGLGITGYLMSTGYKESVEDIHELMANAFLLVALLHVAGIVLHTVRYRDLIGLSMLDGRKQSVSAAQSIPGAKPVAGFTLALVLTLIGFVLIRNYDSANGQLSVFGTTLQLGEAESETNDQGRHFEDDDDD